MIKKLGKHFLLPAASLTVLLVAAGSSAMNPAQRADSIGGPKPASPVFGANPALESFCEQFWGELSNDGSYCRFAQNYHLNLAHVGASAVVTNIPVVPLDTISLDSVTPPDVVIGPDSYGAGGESFIVASSGYVTLRAAPGQAMFSVQRVSVERCYGAPDGRVTPVACP
ncbi:MAG: hypothetical protein ACXVB9_21020 [Bdellovibrionota bacterium]